MRYVGLWHGGHSYSPPYAEDAEEFSSIAEAGQAMRNRRDHGYWQSQKFRYVFRAPASDLTPVAHSENSGHIDLYRVSGDTVTREELETGCPDFRVEFGTRGGIVVSRW